MNQMVTKKNVSFRARFASLWANIKKLSKDNRGEGYLDMAMKILIVVVIGAAILAIMNTAMGRKVDMRNYNLIYSDAARDDESLGQIHQRLNTQAHPEGYRGHSLSMSDVVILQGRKGCTAYYVDRFGFAPLHKFIRPPGGLPETPQRAKRAEKEGR